MDKNRLILLFHTIKYLKFIQIFYRIFFFVRNRFFTIKYPLKEVGIPNMINWKCTIPSTSCYVEDTFTFLNKARKFENNIDWNFDEFGRLWTYNLNYFDFINQDNLNKKEGIELIQDYIKFNHKLKDGLEPYPISLRSINWIKFILKNKIEDKEINKYLYNHYQILLKNLEYHLLGNHLLENGFSLFFGAYFFHDDVMYDKAVKLLNDQLSEQILNDGAHFELSPMYHQIILNKLLDCVCLAKLNMSKGDKFLSFLESKASKMLGWLSQVTYKNGQIPMVNDSAFGIVPESNLLFKYARALNLNWNSGELSDSGYRKFIKNNYELFVDVGHIGPNYQPGHAHSDTFNFELHIDSIPFIIDTGTSTYEKNELRQKERSTNAHNTVSVNGKEQTEVWGGFRVGRRARIINLKETNLSVEATHDGYSKSEGCLHTRKFEVRDHDIVINDILSKNIDGVARFHLHPQFKDFNIDNDRIDFKHFNQSLRFSGVNVQLEVESYTFAEGFNKRSEAKCIKVLFCGRLKTQICT